MIDIPANKIIKVIESDNCVECDFYNGIDTAKINGCDLFHCHKSNRKDYLNVVFKIADNTESL